MNKIIRKENEVLKCILCGEQLPNIAHDECPNCNNVIGFSVKTIDVTSIGELLYEKRLNENIFAFAFDFEFEIESYKNIDHSHCGKLANSFLGVQAHVDMTALAGFGGVSVVAVFNGVDEVEVNLSKEQVDFITRKIMPFITSSMMGSDINSCFEPDIDIDFIEDQKRADDHGIVTLRYIADAMFSAIMPERTILSEQEWKALPAYVKEDMARALQSNTKDLVDLINFTRLGDIYECSDELKDTIENIIHNFYSRFKGDTRLWDAMFSNLDDLNEFNELDELVDFLKSENISFDFYEAFEICDFNNEKGMISILNSNDEECLHVIKLDDKYHVFDKVKTLKDYKIFDLNDKTSVSLDFDALAALICKMNLKRDNQLKDVKDVKDGYIEDMLNSGNSTDLDFNTSEELDDFEVPSLSDIIFVKTPDLKKTNTKSKGELKREALLQQIKELSDEDIINELKRRMSSK